VATWDELKSYIQSKYSSADVSADALKMEFGTDGARSQMVFVFHLVDKTGEHWVQIESPVGEAGSVDAQRALDLMENVLVGGLSQLTVGEKSLLTIRHSLPLRNLDANEFEWPLATTVNTADAFEQQLAQGDVY
jgi:hypothetical protein